MAWQNFESNTCFSESHDTIQGIVGNVTWFNEFLPSGEDRIAEVLLWLCHSMGLCCTIAGEYAMYRGGKLASRPDSLALYVASHPQTWSSEIVLLLQEQPTTTFSMGSVEFEFVPEWSIPDKLLHFVIRYGGEEIVLRIVCTDSVNPYGPRSNMDLTYHIWTTYEYYCANYAIVVLPSQTSGDKIVYVRHYQAEIGGKATWRCGRCVCIIDTSRQYYNFGCRKPEKCACVLCCKQPPYLKSAASEIVMGMYSRTSIYRFSRGWRKQTMNPGNHFFNKKVVHCLLLLGRILPQLKI